MTKLNVENKFIENISCSNVKGVFTSELKLLSINDCQLKSIEKGVFNSMQNLYNLSLSRNEIEYIRNDSFLPLTESNVFYLYISDNKLKEIQNGTFNGLSRLQVLYLDKNQIEDIELYSFEYLIKLLELNMHSNKLNSIRQGMFKGLSSLKILYLNSNQIEEIELYSFDYLHSLIELNIHSNKIKIIKSKCFNGLNFIEKIRLDSNEIEVIELNAFNNMTKPKYLHLQSNKIKQIQDKILFDKTDLEILFLYENSIKNIDKIPFNTLYALKKLHLCSNKITNIQFGNFIHLANLEELKLDKNEIGSFELNTFVGLGNLIYLDLSANKIKILKNNVFDSLIHVQRLELNLNDINQIEENALIDILNLNSLNLDSNQIFTLKDVHFGSKLSSLSIHFNMISNLSDINSKTLKYLFASNNRIQEIYIISHLPNLEYLDLSQNRLIKIVEKSFSKLYQLKCLNLSGNKLELQNEYNNFSYFESQSRLVILDLSYNNIKYLDTNSTFKNLSSLQILNLSNNRLKNIDSFLFGFLEQLSDLNLASNNLSQFILNIGSLKLLKLSHNQLNDANFFLENNQKHTNLTMLELDFNKIESIQEKEFELYPNLECLNLNSNPIKHIDEKAFENLNLLKSLKLSNTSIKHLNLAKNLKELDISFLNFSIFNFKNSNTLEWINLAEAQAENLSIGSFLNNFTRHIDFSFIQLNLDDFKMLGNAGKCLETLKLRKTNLQQIDQINFDQLVNLKYLDLSLNNLTFVSAATFKFTPKLEHLNLSANRLHEFHIMLFNLRYLNLDNNRISTTSNVLWDYFSIEIFSMAHNSLSTYPSFEMNEINSSIVDTFKEIHLNHNQINAIKYFSYLFGKLKWASFDSNNISLIENDAFLNCRSLEFLSIATNRLTKITKNCFYFLFSLTHLNLSLNEIRFIENGSFKNLNKLKSLDLNFNMLWAIENDFFYGLVNLNDLYLQSKHEFMLYKNSFKYLSNISTIVLNEGLVSKYKCLFMHELQRDLQRRISNKYTFYKSINVISNNFSFDESLKSKCDLVFHMFQFNVHYNLKTDFMNDLFFGSCQKALIEKGNTFQFNLKKCFKTFKIIDNEDSESVYNLHPILKVVTNFYYLLSMALILSLVVPVFCLILRYEIFPCLFSRPMLNNEILLKELQSEIQRNRDLSKKMSLGNKNLKKKLNKLNRIMQRNENDAVKNENDFLKMLEDLHALKSANRENIVDKTEII